MRTKPVYSNCLFGTVYFLLRSKKIKNVVFISTTSMIWPAHFVLETNSGHIIHFRYAPGKEHKFIPWWFEGYFEVLRKQEVVDKLSKSGRKVYGKIKAGYLLKALSILLLLLLWLPYTLGWVIWLHCFVIGGAIAALRK